MKTKNYLLPNQFKKMGWGLFILTTLFAIYYLCYDQEPAMFDLKAFALFRGDLFLGPGERSYFTFIDDNIGNEIIGVFGIIACLFIAFSKETYEDELVAKIRLDSLLWATYCNYIILLFTVIFIYGLPFFWVLVFNMYTTLVVFIIRFNWMNYKFKKSMSNEE